MFTLLVFLHLVGVFGFLLAHGTSAAVAFQLKSGMDRSRLEVLLAASGSTIPVFYGSFLLLGVSGFVIVATEGLWRAGWIWASVAVFVLLAIAMYAAGTQPFIRLRRAVASADGADVEPALAAVHPAVLAAAGVLGLLAILWLMVYKPF